MTFLLLSFYVIKAYINVNSSKESFDSFKRNLTNFVENIKSINYDSKSSVLPSKKSNIEQPYESNTDRKTTSHTNMNSNNNGNSNNPTSNSNSASSSSQTLPIYWMLQDPIDEYKYSLNKSVNAQITNKQIDLFNRAAINIL